jgi:nucleoside-diphosphate-sugar epimerase
MPSKLVVVAGATGRLGRLTIDALVTHPGVRVRALVRDAQSSRASFPDAVEVMAFDAVASSPSQRAAAVAGAFAVVSTLQGGPEVIIEGQRALLDAAVAAGARRFIPSDFSYNMFTLPPGTNINTDWRRTFAERAAATATSGLEVVHVLQGIFADRTVLGFLGMLDADQGVLRYWGDGATPIDWTTWEDTARFTAAAAVDDRPVPRRLFVAGERLTALEMAERWERARSRPLVRERLGSLDDLAAETRRRLAAEPQNMFAWLPLMYAQGVFGGQALLGPLENGRYPEIVPETVAQAIERGAL